MIYRVVFEDAPDGSVGAYLPDMPGVGVVGDNRGEAAQMLMRAVTLHVEAMVRDGIPLPEPASAAEAFAITPDLTYVRNQPKALVGHVSSGTSSSGGFELTRTGGFRIASDTLVGAGVA